MDRVMKTFIKHKLNTLLEAFGNPKISPTDKVLPDTTDKSYIKDKTRYPSLSDPSFKLKIGRIKEKMDDAKTKASMYLSANPDDHYFESPLEGDGFYQVEFRHDGQIKTKHVRPSGDMEQREQSFTPSDLGTCKTFQNIARYCFVKAGKNHSSIGPSPADDAANKALIIFRKEILDFYGSTGSYVDDTAPDVSKEKMTDKQAEHKAKKDLETKLGHRLSDSEWYEHLITKGKYIPKAKPQIVGDPDKISDFEKRQQDILNKLRAKGLREHHQNPNHNRFFWF